MRFKWVAQDVFNFLARINSHRFFGSVRGIGTAVILGSIADFYASKYFLESFEGYRLIAFNPFLLLIVGIMCLISFIAGVLPAFRASRLNPIEALRCE